MTAPPDRTKSLYLVKGSRLTDAHPILSTDVVVHNKREGIETCLVLDLNVLADMEDVVFGKRTLEETGLDKAVCLLNGTRGLVLVPGFGFGEVSTSYLASRLAGFEAFLATYCPTYGDAPNATSEALRKRIKNQEAYSCFADLPEGQRLILAPFYASTLKIRLLTLDDTRLPAEKFFDILRFHCDDLDYLTLIPLELAKYVFCQIPGIKQVSFREFCAKMRRILVKGKPKSSIDLSNSCLNAAYDLYYYMASCAGGSPHLALGDYRQDIWILTGDEGLACLADAIYYHAAFPAMLAACYGRIPYRDEYIYFRQCDKLVESLGKRRRQPSSNRSDYYKVASRSFEAIARCEHQALTLLGKS